MRLRLRLNSSSAGISENAAKSLIRFDCSIKCFKPGSDLSSSTLPILLFDALMRSRLKSPPSASRFVNELLSTLSSRSFTNPTRSVRSERLLLLKFKYSSRRRFWTKRALPAASTVNDRKSSKPDKASRLVTVLKRNSRYSTRLKSASGARSKLSPCSLKSTKAESEPMPLMELIESFEQWSSVTTLTELASGYRSVKHCLKPASVICSSASAKSRYWRVASSG